MAKYKNGEGEEVEAFTQEEVDAKIADAGKEATKASETAIEEAKAELKTEFEGKETKLSEEVATLTKKLEETGLSEEQKKRLKDDKDKAEELLKGVTEKFTKEITDLKDSVFGGRKTKLINAVAEKQEDRDKIKTKVDSLMKTGDYTEDEDGISKAVADATTIITGARPEPGFLDGITSSGARGNAQDHKTGKTESEASKAQRKALGISDDDVKKFGPKKE